jgi:hypothetical protein
MHHNFFCKILQDLLLGSGFHMVNLEAVIKTEAHSTTLIPKFHFFCISSCLFFLICIVGGGVQTGSTRHVGHLLAYCTCPGWLWGWRILWNEWQGKPKYSEKTCPGATLSTTNPTWPDPGLNPGRRGGKPVTNRFSYGVAFPLSCSKLFMGMAFISNGDILATKCRTVKSILLWRFW